MLPEDYDLVVSLLLLSYDCGDIDHQDLLLLVLALEDDQSEYDFNQDVGPRLCFENLDDETCLRRFRFKKSEIIELSELLSLPDKFTAPCRTPWSGLEGLLVVLRRLVFPNRLGELCEEFGRSKGVLSLEFNIILKWVHDRWGDRLEHPFDKPFFTPRKAS